MTNTHNKTPVFGVFERVVRGQETGTRLQKIGAAWPTEKGNGYHVVLEEPMNSNKLLLLPLKKYHGS